MNINPKPIERIQMVKAMEFIARQINNEDFIEAWLCCGVADGDIDYGDLAVQQSDLENLSYYIEDDNFAELMWLFTRVMYRAYKDGGLYCNGVVSSDHND